MDTFDLDDSLSEISPKQYREFRLLYNELLGYIERDETDKIAAVSQRLDNALEDSLAMMVAIDRRLTNIQRQKNIVQKTSLHQLFRFPKTTIEVSHAFPLAPLQPSEVESSTTPVASEPVQDSGLEKAREMDDLMKQMATYNRQKSVDAHVAGVGTVSSDISEITKDQPATSGSIARGIALRLRSKMSQGCPFGMNLPMNLYTLKASRRRMWTAQQTLSQMMRHQTQRAIRGHLIRIERPAFGITLTKIKNPEAFLMTFEVERLSTMKRLLQLEARATWVMTIRSLPSLLFWIGLLFWLFN